MRIEFLALSALAASAAAVPIRIITLSGPVPHLAPSEVSHSIKAGNGEMRIMPHPHQPCHGGKKAMGMGGSFGDLLTRLGFVRPPHGHGDKHQYEHGHAVSHHTTHEKDEGEWQVVKAWKNHVEEVGSRIVPIMQGGAVRVLDLEGNEVMGDKHELAVAHMHHGGHLRGHGGHDWHQASFAGRGDILLWLAGVERDTSFTLSLFHYLLLAPLEGLLTPSLQRAISSLTPTEATIFAFVIGAGIGSILHLIFMLFLISVRRMRGLKCKSRQERREARAASKSEGALKLVGGEGEVLPAYEEGEGDRLVEKA